MDDVVVFGPVVHQLSLNDAVDAGIIADYRVIIAAVDRGTLTAVADHLADAGIDANLLAGAIAKVRSMGDLRVAGLSKREPQV
jgi:predicted helicase